MRLKRLILILSVFKCISLSGQSIIGVGCGFAFYDRMEINLNYSYAPKYFYLKIQYAHQPITKNMGQIGRGSVVIGFTTPVKKSVSWQIYGGIVSSFGYEWNSNSFSWAPSGTPRPCLGTGFFVRPNKEKRILIGIESLLYGEHYWSNSYKVDDYSYNEYTIALTGSISFMLNKEK